jgi:8-oxo-dGTP diphosphatase
VVWRRGSKALKIALVHRARYDDWSLPKGKLERDESGMAAAVREVLEETGASVAVSRLLGHIRYDTRGSAKTVRYWAMSYTGGTFSANREVDRIEWVSPAKALRMLSYETERAIVSAFMTMPLPDSMVILVRHAKAGKRSEWSAPDELRPLDPTGVSQAENLVSFLSAFAPQAVISADRVRCEQTVAPLAKHLGTEVVLDPRFNDESCLADPEATLAALWALAEPDRVTVVSSQGYTIPTLIERVLPGIDATTRKGAVWALAMKDGQVIGADYYEDPAA